MRWESLFSKVAPRIRDVKEIEKIPTKMTPPRSTTDPVKANCSMERIRGRAIQTYSFLS
jgi:hypothetical protein